MKKALLVIVALFIQHAAVAQTSQRPPQPDLSYTYGELRFVDVDTNGGDGFRLAGSFELEGPWLLVGAFTALDFNNNVDSTLLELGGGYVWDYSEDFDLVGTLRLVRAEVDTPGGSADDTGCAFSGRSRSVNTRVRSPGVSEPINLDNSDTYLELAGDIVSLSNSRPV